MNTDAHSLEFHLADEEATSELGARLARALDSVKSEILGKGLNIKLVGDLGAGKTYLMRSALRALGFEGRVKSPTFSLLETYKVDGFTVNHFDFYRVDAPRELRPRKGCGVRVDVQGRAFCSAAGPDHYA